ncbi:TetR/AcrR family transcriptional regulator [Actinomadura opuntiae]|uniref:TetR/AcrR family transcriptional regulator n=1 Tax=Actinomadura sp. OS1-43 TaxID=604315 RepID=UPI00255B3CFD|nr:TetR/AcrR family transcriptional regulator [Actinomadura sp. OS1-43]MDL4819476.1 TetR/AcrR family transcriptional regulator [Actinomadura sp. OS1-43]
MSAQKDADGRDRILRAAARLIAESGGEPVSTRAVCAAAGVGAPTLYHHFGDKQGLLDAVAAHGFEEYLASKRAQRGTGDPLNDLRHGWDVHVEFGVSHPAVYALMYGTPRTPPAADEAYAILLGLVGAVARAGRLRVPVETAAQMIQAAGVGVVLFLIANGDDGGDLSARTREAVLAAVTVPDGPADRPAPPDARTASALALRAALSASPPSGLTPAETALLSEWLDRLAT